MGSSLMDSAAAGPLQADQVGCLPPEQGRLAVIGDPVSHSLSPAMHNAALAVMAQSYPRLKGWHYIAIHVRADELPRTLRAMTTVGFRGVNLTIPHKVAVMDLLGGLSDFARRSGAVNTLLPDGPAFRGDNTDGFGLLQAVRDSFQMEMSGRDIWILGAGGAARAIIAACKAAGAVRITVVNRSHERLEALAETLACSGVDGVRFQPTALADWHTYPGALLINATSLGLKADDPSPLPPQATTFFAAVYDTTYGVANRLAAQCAATGVRYADGLSMLVWQGVRSLELWTGCPVPAEVMAQAAAAELKARSGHG
jgi:shikimate dehydrogenase